MRVVIIYVFICADVITYLLLIMSYIHCREKLAAVVDDDVDDVILMSCPKRGGTKQDNIGMALLIKFFCNKDDNKGELAEDDSPHNCCAAHITLHIKNPS